MKNNYLLEAMAESVYEVIKHFRNIELSHLVSECSGSLSSRTHMNRAEVKSAVNILIYYGRISIHPGENGVVYLSANKSGAMDQ
jgi:hypothetical protein